jgi:hypothetical protein
LDNFNKLFAGENPYHHTYEQVKAFAIYKGLTLSEALARVNHLIRNALVAMEEETNAYRRTKRSN